MLRTRLPLRIATAFDLHVLGLPPAFVLSQDQTLKLKLRFVSRLVTVYSRRVPKHINVALHSATKWLRKRVTVDCLKALNYTLVQSRATQGQPPSTFLFLPIQMSNSVVIRRRVYTLRSELFCPDQLGQVMSPEKLEKNRFASAASQRRRRRWCVYSSGLYDLSTRNSKNFHVRR